MDPIGCAQNVISVVQFMWEVYKTVQENKELCKKLVERLRAIVEILEKYNYKNQLAGEKLPICLKNLLEITFDCQDFICYFGKATPFHTLKNIVFSSGVKSSFEDLNNRLGQNVSDCTFFFSVDSSKKLDHIIQKMDSTSMSISNNNALNMSHNHYALEKKALILWVDPSESALRDDILKLNPQITFKTCVSTSILKAQILASRSLKTEQTAPLRIITNRRRLVEGGKPDEWNETAYQEVIDFVKKDVKLNTPIMIFMGNPELANQINHKISSSNDFKNTRASFLHATTNPKTLTNYAIMSTILFVWPQKFIAKYEDDLLRHYQENGIVCELKYTYDEAMNFLLNNKELRLNKRFKIVIPRVFYIDGSPKSMAEFVSEARFRGFDNHILIFTSHQNFESAKADFAKFHGVQVATNQREAEDFGLSPYDDHHHEDPKDYSLNTSVDFPNLNNKHEENNKSPELPTSPQLPRKEFRGMFVCYNISCKNLVSKDSNGLSDPYVVFECGEKATQTYVIYENLNPVFQRGCYRLLDVSSRDKIKVTVWDKDPLGRDFEGQTELDMKVLTSEINEKNATRTYTKTLEKRKGKKHYEKEIVGGTVTLEVTFFITE